MHNDSTDAFSERRRHAEETVRVRSSDALSAEDTHRLVHELQIHQIELEMQNDELRRAQLKLEVARDQYADLYDFAPVGYLTVAEHGRILEANLTVAALLGMERGLLLGRPFSQFVVRTDQDLYYKHRQRIFATATRQTCEIKLVRNDASEFMASLESQVVQDSDGRCHPCRIVISDISERKRLEDELTRYRAHLEAQVQQRTQELTKAHQDQLRQNERLASIGTLAAGIAHEINNPIASILLYAQSARFRRGEADALTLEEVLQRIAEDAKRCGRIVRSVLAFARQGTTDKRPNALNRMIQYAIDLTRSYAQKHGSVIQLELDDNLPSVWFDPTEMAQVLVNLIRNAVEAGNSKSRIRIRTEVTRQAAQVTIQDNGCGIPAETIGHIFDPFYTTRKSKGGMGLGLSLSHGIVTQHGGTLTVDSRPGQGTTFRIELPLTPEPVQHG